MASRTKQTIYHIIPRIEYGGTERMVTQIMTSAKISSSWRQVLYVMKDESAENIQQLMDAGCELRVLPIGKSKLGAVIGIIKSILKLRRDCRQERPAVIMGWLYYGNILASMINAKGALTIHNIRNSGFDTRAYKATLRWALWINAMMSKRADLTVYNSHAGQRDHHDARFDHRRNVVMHNGIDTDVFAPSAAHRKAWRRQHGFTASDKVILVVGRNDPQKRYDEVLRLAAMFPKHHVVAIGEGVERLNGPANFTALAHTKNIHEIYPGADVILSASSFGEGFQNTIAEGMAAGLVPVCHKAGDVNILVGDAGFVAEDYDVLATQLGNVLKMTMPAMAAAATASRQQIVNHYSRAKFDQAFLEMLNSVVTTDKGAS